MDKIYDEFFINNDKFTIEDYSDNLYGVYHEDMFVGTCAAPDKQSAIPVALEYYKKCHA